MDLTYNTETSIDIPLWAAIEIYQDIIRGLVSGDKDNIRVAAECLAQHINNQSDVWHQEQALIFPDCQEGLPEENENHFHCIQGHIVTKIDQFEHCSVCPQQNLCNGPQNGEIRIAEGVYYHFGCPTQNHTALDYLTQDHK